jgi:hypothetical protein
MSPAQSAGGFFAAFSVGLWEKIEAVKKYKEPEQ